MQVSAKKHVVAHTLLVQSSVQCGKTGGIDTAIGVAQGMFESVAALVAMQGIVRMMWQFAKANSWVVEDPLVPHGKPIPVRIKSGTLWRMSRTLLAHAGWRHFPLLSRWLTEITLGGTFRGLSLHDTAFLEPKQPSALKLNRDQARASCAARREEGFMETLSALERLTMWAMEE